MAQNALEVPTAIMANLGGSMKAREAGKKKYPHCAPIINTIQNYRMNTEYIKELHCLSTGFLPCSDQGTVKTAGFSVVW